MHMNNPLRDVLEYAIIEELGSLNITDKLNLSEVRSMADEIIEENIQIKDMLDVITRKINAVIDSKEPFIRCDMCGDKIKLGDEMFVQNDNYFDSLYCLLGFVGASKIALEPSFFSNGMEEE